MAYSVKPVEVWAGDIRNKPGMLARTLEALTLAGAELEFIVARRLTENSSRVFVAPLKGKRQRQAADAVGLVPATGMFSIRVEGPDRGGLGADICRAVADVGLNIRGFSAAALGKKMVNYLAFSSESEALAASKALRKGLRRR